MTTSTTQAPILGYVLGALIAAGLMGVAAYALLRAPPDEHAGDRAEEQLTLRDAEPPNGRSRTVSYESLDMFEARRRYRRSQGESVRVEHDERHIAINRDEAVASFESLMNELDAMAQRGERPGKKRRADLYRAANDTFAAMASTLDATDPDDAMQLENAHLILLENLDRLGIERATYRNPEEVHRRRHTRRPAGRRG